MKVKIAKLMVVPIVLTLLVVVPVVGNVGPIQDWVNLTLADPPWCYPGSCNLLADDYADVDAQVMYHVKDTSFIGNLEATGMMPETLYQLKLEGRPTCKYGDAGDDEANVKIGSVGRWWNDTEGWNEPSDEAAAASMADGDCVLGYVVFDCAMSDEVGDLNKDFHLDYSWHVCGTPERGEVMLPDGDYDVSVLLTENHQWWRTVLVGEVQFTVDHWLDKIDIGSGDGYQGQMTPHMTIWSMDVCPTDTGGTYGGIADDPESEDGECRLVWAHDFKPNKPYAELKLWMGNKIPSKLFIRALDGLADDSFKVIIQREKKVWEPLYEYQDMYDTETWLLHEIDLPEGEYPMYQLRVRIIATGEKWEMFDTYGQLAVDWVGLWADGIVEEMPEEPVLE